MAKRRLNTGVVTLGWVSFLNDAASEMIYPLLPDFVTRILGAGPAALGLIEGLAEATASLAKVAAGWWSDSVRRRKPFVVLGYSIAAVARPLTGLATSWSQVLAIRFSDRLGKGLRTPPRDALLAELAPSQSLGRAFGLQRAMDNAGALVGPILAALLLRFWIAEERTLFLLALVPGVLAVLLLVTRIPEKKGDTAERAAPIEISPRLSRSLWTAIAIFSLFTLANSTDAFLLLRAGDRGGRTRPHRGPGGRKDARPRLRSLPRRRGSVRAAGVDPVRLVVEALRAADRVPDRRRHFPGRDRNACSLARKDARSKDFGDRK